MKAKTESKEIKKAGDKTIKIPDWKKQIQEFIKIDDKKHFLFFKMIEVSDREQAELIECLLLKMFDNIRDEMLTSDFYTKKDLADINFFLQAVKLHIQHESLDDMEVRDSSNGMGLSYAT